MSTPSAPAETTEPDLPLCSQAARRSGDDPAGSAAQFNSFLLLDHRAPWGATAADDAVDALPAADRARVQRTEGLRAFAVRPVHPRFQPHPRPAVFGPVGPAGRLQTWPDAAESAGSGADLLFAVCTNGRRDRCCAVVGRGIAVELEAEFGEQVLEISHLGGHRYAGTMLVLPWGYAYGFLDTAAARRVILAAHDGMVLADGLRGRADLEPAAQAAEVLLRRELGPATPDAVRIIAVRLEAPDRATVAATVNGESTTLDLRREAGPTVNDTLCGGKPFATGHWVVP